MRSSRRWRWLGPTSAQALSPSQFIAKASGPAQAGQRAHQVPASVAIAQAILESGWGESSLTKEGHAFFGIKCSTSGNNGPYTSGCIAQRTRECRPDGSCYYVTAYFRGYRRDADSFKDHGLFLRSRSWYANAFRYTGNPDRFIREIAKAGYATDPAYPSKIISLMRKYNLYRFNGSERVDAAIGVLADREAGFPRLPGHRGAVPAEIQWPVHRRGWRLRIEDQGGRGLVPAVARSSNRRGGRQEHLDQADRAHRAVRQPGQRRQGRSGGVASEGLLDLGRWGLRS